MSSSAAWCESLAHSSSGPAEVLTRLNSLLLEDLPGGRFVTMVYAELDPAKPNAAPSQRGASPALAD